MTLRVLLLVSSTSTWVVKHLSRREPRLQKERVGLLPTPELTHTQGTPRRASLLAKGPAHRGMAGVNTILLGLSVRTRLEVLVNERQLHGLQQERRMVMPKLEQALMVPRTFALMLA